MENDIARNVALLKNVIKAYFTLQHVPMFFFIYNYVCADFIFHIPNS